MRDMHSGVVVIPVEVEVVLGVVIRVGEVDREGCVHASAWSSYPYACAAG